jgi:hypothetical protein
MSRTAAARGLSPDEIQRILKLLAIPEISLEQIAERFQRSSETIRLVNVRFQIRSPRRNVQKPAATP